MQRRSPHTVSNKFIQFHTITSERKKSNLQRLSVPTSVTNSMTSSFSVSESLTQFFEPTLSTNRSFHEGLDFRTNEALPIFRSSEEIKSAIRENQIIIVTGLTGCGKVSNQTTFLCRFLVAFFFQTTQVPKMIMEYAMKEVPINQINILVSQPRKIAAITNATRLAQEIKGVLGGTVGYQVIFNFSFPCTKMDTTDQTKTKSLNCSL